ncbi:MAG: dihydroorotate dehydrogenase electron transfer subunit [Lachnospiraceae bacterium]|nr:dihydroorotate dehydrogenase electron transfer subunit [Lachnospiraceae bacterium]
MKIKETATTVSQERLCKDVYSLWIATNAAGYASAGQFVSLYPNSDSMLLPRPISICEIDGGKEPGLLRLVYRVAGAGTLEFSHLAPGDTIEILGPNGNGFLPFCDRANDKETKALLVGGGIGIPPMVELAKTLSCDVTVVAGYRSSEEMFLTRELEREGKLIIATDDGSCGIHGTVIDAIKEEKVQADVIYACGPRPMLKGIKAYAEEKGIPAFVSMEERMACGVGACLGCVCESTAKDEHSQVNNKRVCVDGPVFPASEVVL